MSLTLPNPVRKERSIPNYRQQIRKALPDHIFKPDHMNLLWFLVHAGVVSGSWYLLTNHFSWWLAPILSIAIGHTFGCMGFLAHDVCHGGSVRHLALRDLLAGIGFSPFWISPRLWRRWHNGEHHGNTQIEGIDPDHLFTIDDYKGNKILQGLYKLSPLLRNLVIFGSFTFRMEQQQLRMVVTYMKSRNTGAWEKAVILSQLLVMVGLWVGVSAFLGTQVLIWGYLIPLVIANTMVISYIATNHFLNPLADESDVLGTSLTVTLPKALQWLDPWHQYFGAHVAHHLFPMAPARHVRLIESKAKELFPDRYHAMPLFTALKKLWDTPWVYENKTVLIDPEKQERHGTLGHGMEN